MHAATNVLLQRRRVFIALVTFASSVLGCAADDRGRTIEDPIAEGLMPTDWIGTQLGVAQPTFVERGEPALAPPPKGESVRHVVHPSTGNFQPVPEEQLSVIDLSKRRSYDVTLPEGIDIVAAARAQQ